MPLRQGGPTVGIVGGGQLARMMYQAAISLDVDIRVLAADGEEPAPRVARRVTRGAPTGPVPEAFARACDVVTFDHERVDPELIDSLLRAGPAVRPGAPTLRVATDKLAQRRALAAAGFPVPAFALVAGAGDVGRFAAQHGWPVVLKRPRGGYDGRGVWVVAHEGDAAPLFGDGPLLAEAYVDIETELAVLVARRPAGEVVVYPVAETVQRDGICHEVRVPAAISAPLAARAAALAGDVAAAVDAVGILAVELFVTGGDLVVNELAARPHNSGPFTIEGCHTSQFENHLRAILDWPLGSTGLRAPAVVMVNVLGVDANADPRRRLGEALALGPAHVHLYGKRPHSGRKLGHVTVLGSALPEAATLARRAAAVLAAPLPELIPGDGRTVLSAVGT